MGETWVIDICFEVLTSNADYQCSEISIVLYLSIP